MIQFWCIRRIPARIRLRFHGTSSSWNLNDLGTDRPPVSMGLLETVPFATGNRASNGSTCELDPNENRFQMGTDRNGGNEILNRG